MNFKLFIFSTCLLLLFFKHGFIQAQDPAESGPKLSAKEITQLIDTISYTLNTWYVFPEKPAQIVSIIKKNYKSGAYESAKNSAELADRINQDIRKFLKESPFHFRYDAQLARDIKAPKTDSVKKKERELGLNAERENNFTFTKTEILPGNIGYIRWDAFTSYIEESQPTVNGAFQFVSNCKALIIDMRFNSGGSRSMVLQVQNYFFKEKTHMIDMIDNLYDTIKRDTDPSKTAFKLNMPLYILTSKETFSGAEDFAYSLQKTKRATLVGDTTAGRSYPIKAFGVGRGFEITIPISRPVEKEDWNGKGLKPEVAVQSEQALTKAQVVIFTKVLQKPGDEMEQNSFQWNLNNLLSELLVKTPDPAVLNAYTGKYDNGMDFQMKDGRLFCKNGARRNAPLAELKYIDNNLFVLDEYAHVEFVKDASGAYSKIKMHWKTGEVTENKKM